MPGNGISVHFRHHDIQDQKIIDTKLRILRAGLAIIDDLHIEPLMPKQCANGVRQQFFIFNDQNLQKDPSVYNECFIIIKIIQSNAEVNLKMEGIARQTAKTRQKQVKKFL